MTTTEHGHVLATNAEKLGDTLEADTAATATALVVGDVADFDELGGSLIINDAILAYSTVDDETGTITLVDALPADADAGDPVYVWDTQRLTVGVEYVAQVEMDDDQEGDPLEAVVMSHLVDELPDGIRGLVGESVLLEEEDDTWRVIDVLGISGLAAGNGDGFGALRFRNLDSFDLTADGAQSVLLTYLPIDGSEHVYWNGLQQRRGVDWTRAGQVVSVLVDDLDTDDVIDVEYAYLYGMAETPVEETPLTSACANGTPQSAWGEEFYVEKAFPGGDGHRYRIRVLFADRDPDAVWLVGLVFNDAGTIFVHATDTDPGAYKVWVGDEFQYYPSDDSSDGLQVHDGNPNLHGELVGVQIKPWHISGISTAEAGFTDPTICKFYIGTKFRDIAGDTDEPWTGMSDA